MPPITGLRRDRYPGAEQTVYLDAAALGIVSTDVTLAMADVLARHQALGVADAATTAELVATTRRSVADLVGGAADRVAFTQNTSTGLALVANGIDWQYGDNVVVPVGEFPSNFYPWTQLRRHGVEVREIAMPAGHAAVEDLAAAIDPRTRVVAISAVQYSSGHRTDLAALGALCRTGRALLVVDGTQAVGALPIDVDAVGVDVLAVSAHKWMLGPLGIGFVHLSPRAMDRLQPSTVGWLSVEEPFSFDHEPRLAVDARRFESGTENVAGLAGLGAAIGLVLDAGRKVVEAQVLDCTAELAGRLTERGWTVHRDPDRATWSGILIVSSGRDDGLLHRRLLDAGVRCSLRGRGIRFSPHYYTDSTDLDAVVDVVA